MAKKKKSNPTSIKVKVGGKNVTFTKFSCRAPKTTADTLVKQGFTYRIVGNCVFKGPKRKK